MNNMFVRRTFTDEQVLSYLGLIDRNKVDSTEACAVFGDRWQAHDLLRRIPKADLEHLLVQGWVLTWDGAWRVWQMLYPAPPPKWMTGV